MKPDNKKEGHRDFPGDDWKGKVSNSQQLGGIETAVLDNGGGSGVRIAWVNTGGGLRYKVVLDRGMDIADAYYNKYSLSWISHMGVKPPNPSAVKGIRWLNSFGGGLLTTCGLTHVGGPEEDEFGERGLHDRISHTPAEIISVKQPDLKSGDLTMSMSGKMIQSTVFGPHLELKRTISSVVGSSMVRIDDEITNIGNESAPHMLLYHCNLGWPLINEGTEIIWEGDLNVPNDQSRKIFKDGSDYKICRKPMENHSGSGEAVGFIDITPTEDGQCECGVLNRTIGLRLDMKFKKEQLKWLTNWQHWGKKEYVMALEPCTHPPIGQTEARRNDTLIFIEPGETKTYSLEISARAN